MLAHVSAAYARAKKLPKLETELRKVDRIAEKGVVASSRLERAIERGRSLGLGSPEREDSGS